MVVNPFAAQVGAVVLTAGTAGFVSLIKLVNAAEAGEVHIPIVAVTV